jgi:LysM repeat protein
VGVPPAQKTHAIKPGDTLTSIAIKYGTTVAAIASLNNITNINNISVGQLLFIP